MTGDAIRFHHGVAAEEAVAAHYRRAGADILGLRCRTSAGEIDLVVRQGDEILFVEVKARKTHGAGRAAVSLRQQRRIFQAAETWLGENHHSPLMPCRFDVATVDAEGTVEVIENAFSA